MHAHPHVLITETPETPAEDPSFLKQCKGEILFTTLSLSLHSHSCSLPVITLGYFVPHLPQKQLCRSPKWHLLSVVPHAICIAEHFLGTTPTTSLKKWSLVG